MSCKVPTLFRMVGYGNQNNVLLPILYFHLISLLSKEKNINIVDNIIPIINKYVSIHKYSDLNIYKYTKYDK